MVTVAIESVFSMSAKCVFTKELRLECAGRSALCGRLNPLRRAACFFTAPRERETAAAVAGGRRRELSQHQNIVYLMISNSECIHPALCWWRFRRPQFSLSACCWATHFSEIYRPAAASAPSTQFLYRIHSNWQIAVQIVDSAVINWWSTRWGFFDVPCAVQFGALSSKCRRV